MTRVLGLESRPTDQKRADSRGGQSDSSAGHQTVAYWLPGSSASEVVAAADVPGFVALWAAEEVATFGGVGEDVDFGL